MPARRCSMCGINWPLLPEYKKCPKCEEKTDPISNARAMPKDEAQREKSHYEFDRFYEDYDSRSDPDRLTTDSLSDTLSETLNPG